MSAAGLARRMTHPLPNKICRRKELWYEEVSEQLQNRRQKLAADASQRHHLNRPRTGTPVRVP